MQDLLSDGFVGICVDTSLNVFEGKCRVLIEGQYKVNGALATPIVPDKPIKITSPRYVDQMFTAGSILAEGLKTVFAECPNLIEVHALPRLDAGGAVKSVYTLTVTGPATSDGIIDIFLGDKKWSVADVLVEAGDTATDIAAAIAAAIPASFPYVVTVALGVVTLTAVNAGTVGNFLNPVLNWHGRQNYWPAGVSIAVAHPTPGATDPAPIDYADALGECCYSCYALLGGSTTWQRGLRDWIRSAWDCTKPQCFGHGYTYNSGSLGQVLATGDNSGELSRIPVPLNDVNFPWQLVAAYAARSCCSACTNPELSIQGRDHGRFGTIWRPQACAMPWTYDESEQLKAAGFATYGPVALGSGALTNPYIHADVTNWLYDEMGRENATFRDTNSRRLATKTALELAEQLQETNGLGFYTKNTKIPQGVFGTNKRLVTAALHSWAKTRVGVLFSEFDDLERDLQVFEDFELKPPCHGVPCKMAVMFRYRPPCRIARYDVMMRPQLIDNCARA